MAVNKFRFDLDIEKEDYIPKFKVKQYDTAIFYVNLCKKGIPFPIENQIIKIFVKKSDGTIIYQENEIYLEAGAIRINIKNQALTCPGMTYAELELKANDGQVTSATFLYEVKEKVGSDKAVESVTDMSTLEKFDKYIEDSQKELDKFKNDLSKLEDLVANKDKLEGQNTEAKVNISELEKVLDQANNIVSDEGKKVVGNNVFSKDTTNGYVQDIKLEGRTMINIIPLDFSQWKLGGSGDTLGLNAVYQFILSDLPVKSNTLYSYKLIGLPDNYDNHWFHLLAPTAAYPKEGTFTSIAAIGRSYLHLYPKKGKKFTLEDIKNVKIVLLEGKHKIDGYFESLKSVGDGVDSIEINSCNLNAFNEDLLISRLEDDGYYHFRTSGNNRCTAFMGFVDGKAQRITSMTPNLVTDLSDINLNECRFLIGLNGDKSDDKVLISIKDIGYLNTSFFKGCEAIVVDNNHIKFRKIELSYGKTSNSYVPHKSDKKKVLYFGKVDNIWKKPILRQLDTIENRSGWKYYYNQRSEENVILDSDLSMITQYTNLDYIACRKPTDSKYYNNYANYDTITDSAFTYIMNQVPDWNDVNNIGKFSSQPSASYLWFGVKKGTTLEQSKTMLVGKKLVYQLAQQKVYECLDISVRSFRDEMMLSINAGQLDPRIEYYLPTGFLSSDSSLSNKLEDTDSELIKLMFDFLAHNHDSRYPLKNAGDVTDFNNCLTEGTYSVGSTSDLPNAPYFDGRGIYGTLEVLTKKNENIQRFTSNINIIFIRFKNYEGTWSNWVKQININDFESGVNATNGYQRLPSGMLIQWGTTLITFTNYRASGYIYYPITFKEFSNITGNVASNDYGGYCETIASVACDNLSRGYAEALDFESKNLNGKQVRINWMAIGK